MLNNAVLVGRVVKEPEIIVYESGAHAAKVLLSVVRPFRNEKNEYDTDLFPIYVWHKMADVVCDYVGAGSILGFKCRLGTHWFEVEGMKLIMIDVIAERVSFIHLKQRASKTLQQVEEETMAREFQKGNFVEYDSNEMNDKLDDPFIDEDLDGLYDEEKEKKEKAETGKKKAK